MVALARWTGAAAGIAFLVCIFVLPWFTIFRRTRKAAGGGYVVSSFVLGGSLWIMCFLTVWDAWGVYWALAGVLVLGVGVLPMSLVIFATSSQWALFIEVLLIGGLAIGVRTLGVWIISKAQ